MARSHLAFMLLALPLVSAFRMQRNEVTCRNIHALFKKTCGTKTEGCEACVREGFSKLEDACGEKAKIVAPLICKAPTDDDRRGCRKAVAGFKKTCGAKTEGCEACVRGGFSKLEDACGEKAKIVAPLICKAPTDDDRSGCRKAVAGFKKTCGAKTEGCEVCVRGGFSKLEDACGEKAKRVAQAICKAEEEAGETEDEDEEASQRELHADDEQTKEETGETEDEDEEAIQGELHADDEQPEVEVAATVEEEGAAGAVCTGKDDDPYRTHRLIPCCSGLELEERRVVDWRSDCDGPQDCGYKTLYRCRQSSTSPSPSPACTGEDQVWKSSKPCCSGLKKAFWKRVVHWGTDCDGPEDCGYTDYYLCKAYDGPQPSYVLTNFGASTCSSSDIPITSSSECEVAADSFGMVWHGQDGSPCPPVYPSGCITSKVSKSACFNSRGRAGAKSNNIAIVCRQKA